MMASSTMELALIRMRAGRPSRWWAISLSIALINPLRTSSGATSSSAYCALREKPLRLLNRCATSSPMASSVVSSPKSS